MDRDRGDRARKKKKHAELVNPNRNKNANSDDGHESVDVADYEECDGENVDGVGDEITNKDDEQVEEKEKGHKDV